ncbi:ral GTPase-activating protein subunit alpha-2-like [Antedon mediterranea]|uniref:ral GTPase-activating protein subunit alpha-2-like n=1 Tax=Antedon mediterranea TaxID=105859 RepID=UPI003AF79791
MLNSLAKPIEMLSKKAHGDLKKSSSKVLDPKRDPSQRLKHLRVILENYDITEAKSFFEQYYSHVYHIFYENLISVEATLRQKAHRTHREELDSVLYIFEKILLFVPDLIHQRWQFNSIGRILKKLLHVGNTVKVRIEGLKLFILWFQALQDSADEECYLIYATLIPGFPVPHGVQGSDLDGIMTQNSKTQQTQIDLYPINEVEICPILPTQSGDSIGNLSQIMFDELLQYTVAQVSKLQWNDPDQTRKCFVFLLDNFKKFYLPHVFPEFSHTTSLYAPILDIPSTRKIQPSVSSSQITHCKVSVVRWLVAFIANKKEKVQAPQPDVAKDKGNTLDRSLTASISQDSPEVLGHNAVITNSSKQNSGPLNTQLEDLVSDKDKAVVRQVLYSNRENINFVHEILRQGFLLPMSESQAVKRSLKVYQEWIQSSNGADNQPVFLRKPPDIAYSPRSESASEGFEEWSGVSQVDSPTDKVQGLIPEIEEQTSSTPINKHLKVGTKTKRTDSYLSAITYKTQQQEKNCLEAGLQPTLQVFITNSANAFLLEPESEDKVLKDHIDICKRVLGVFRHIVMYVKMEQETVEQLLKVLLKITESILSSKSSKAKLTLANQLSQVLFQTLIVTWIKANLVVRVPLELWDELLRILSSLTHWKELIDEWAKTMGTLTRILAKQVYSLDLKDLPLDKLSEQKEKKLRHRISSTNKDRGKHERTFSQEGWNSSSPPPVGSPERSRMLTMSSHDDINVVRNRGMQQMKIASKKEAVEILTKLKEYEDERRKGMVRQRSFPEDDRSEKNRLIRSSSTGDVHQAAAITRLQEMPLYTTNCMRKAFTESEIRLISSDFNEEDVGENDDTINEDDNYQGRTTEDGMSLASSEITDPSNTESCRLTPTSLSDVLDPQAPILHTCSNHSISLLGSFSAVSPMEDSVSLEDQVNAEFKNRLLLRQHNKEEDEDMQYEDEMLVPDTSIISGGNRAGWLPDVAVVLWKRMLGILGDVNKISNPRLHAEVMDCLCEYWQMLAKMRENLGISTDNQTTPPPPVFIPPLKMFSPWLFQATYLSDRFQKGRLFAYKLLCMMTVRRHDHPLPQDHLLHFYRVLHFGLVGTDQEIINIIIQHSAPAFFSCQLPGATMLILDFIQAANMISATIDLDAPRTEAISLIGSLVCFPNLFCEIPLLQPSSKEISTMTCGDVKDHLITILLKCGRREPSCEARCIAICSIGIFLFEELVHCTFHYKIKEAINVLLACLKFNYKLVAQVACDMLLLVSSRADRLGHHYPEMPKKIIEVLSMTISGLQLNTELSDVDEDKKFLVSLMFCLLEWCMAVPLSSLREPAETKQSKEKAPIIQTVFKVVQSVAEGLEAGTRNSINLSELSSPDYDPHVTLESLKDVHQAYVRRSPTHFDPNDLLPNEGKPSIDVEGTIDQSVRVIRLAATTVMCHLVNHLNQFPLDGGSACLTASINEYDDIPDLELDEISPSMFQSPNMQFFVYNESVLVSVVELPENYQYDFLDGDMTGDLTTRSTRARLIIRDCSGKYSWDAAILYATPPAPEPTPTATGTLRPGYINTRALSPIEQSVESTTPGHQKQSLDDLPTWEEDETGNCDMIDELLQYLGYTSSECLLRPGIPLNLPSPGPEQMPVDLESLTTESLLLESSQEQEYYKQHKTDNRMSAEVLSETACKEPSSAFQLCRQLFSQLGFMNWEKRPQMGVLKKNDKLARELKNLDSRQCRETHKIAIFYVAEGQEDKNSVLLNNGGSRQYEDFVAALAWEVDLAKHPGFMGGLQRNKSTGDTAPYYATSTMEVIFHVSTRMPSSPDDLNKKLRHLGNDEIHIVWSEHTRDYRRGILATEFGDVIIVIYPLANQLFRIQILRKPEVPFFGPLFDGAIVDHKVLPELVRATAVSASRAKRSVIPLYQKFFEERSANLDNIITNHKEPTTFEEFSAQVFAPSLSRNIKPGVKFIVGNKLKDPDSASLAAAILDAQIKTTKSQKSSRSNSIGHLDSSTKNRRSYPKLVQTVSTAARTGLSQLGKVTEDRTKIDDKGPVEFTNSAPGDTYAPFPKGRTKSKRVVSNNSSEVTPPESPTSKGFKV